MRRHSNGQNYLVKRIGLILLVSTGLFVPAMLWAQPSDEGEDQKVNMSVASAEGVTLPMGGQSVDIEPDRDTGERFRWAGETYVYSCRINGAEAMRAALRAGEVKKKQGQPYVPVALQARSMGFFHSIYPVNDRADTFMNPLDFLPYRSEKYFHENGKRRTYEVEWDRGAYRADVKKQRPNQRTTFTEVVPSETHDMLSWLYDLRARSFNSGDQFDYYIYDGWKMTHLELRVVGMEEVYTPAGWFEAWKFAYDRHIVTTRGEGGGARESPVKPVRKTTSEHSGHLWLSRDQKHMPLRLTIGTKYGLGEVVLLKRQ